MQNKITFMNSNGNKVDCSLVALFKNGDISYVAYTDSNPSSEKKDLLVSRYERKGDNIYLSPIEDEKEWEFIEDYLENENIDEEDLYA